MAASLFWVVDDAGMRVAMGCSCRWIPWIPGLALDELWHWHCHYRKEFHVLGSTATVPRSITLLWHAGRYQPAKNIQRTYESAQLHRHSPKYCTCTFLPWARCWLCCGESCLTFFFVLFLRRLFSPLWFRLLLCAFACVSSTKYFANYMYWWKLDRSWIGDLVWSAPRADSLASSRVCSSQPNAGFVAGWLTK